MAKATEAVLDRRYVAKAILAKPKDALLVTGLGSSTYDAGASGDDPPTFYLWGGMGAAAMMGMGLALAQSKRKVLVLTGDGEMLMGLGALTTIGTQGYPMAIRLRDGTHIKNRFREALLGSKAFD